MKILCVIDSLGSGGAQRQMVVLAIEFKKRGHEVFFLTYHEINFYTFFLNDENIPVKTIVEQNYLKRLLKMRRYIRHGKFDAVLSFLDAANFICELAGLPFRKWKLVVGERSANPEILTSNKLRFFRLIHFLSDYVVANSYENIKIVKKINPVLSYKKLKVIYNMVDFDIWQPALDYSPYKNNKLNILVAASYRYLKNARGLVEAITLLSEEEKEKLRIEWYGNESLDNSFNDTKALVQKYNLQHIFTFNQATSDICQKMQYADVIGLFSFYEGLPNVICEGMALGKPIISSSISDIPKLLKNDLNLTFNPHDVKDIARVLSYILSMDLNKLQQIGAKNKEIASTLFDKEKIVLDYMTLMK